MTDIELNKQLEIYKTQGANILMPSIKIEGLSEFHAPVIETVMLSANLNDGDVYPHSNEEDQSKQKFRLTKQALMKLSVCAGIIWSVSETRRVDDGRNRDYCCYQAVGGVKKADGTPVFFKAQYDMDFEVLEDELRELYLSKTKSKYMRDKSDKEKTDYVDFCLRRDVLQKRKHKIKLCEAGAMNRVIREILALKNAYTAVELSKPFVMARIVFRPDYSDKEVKAKMHEAYIQSMTGIYGAQAISNAVKETEPIDVTPLQGKEEDPEPIHTGEELGQQKLNSEDSLLLDFENSDELNQCKTLTLTAVAKGYDLAGYMSKCKVKDLTAFKKEKRIDIFKHLRALPDKKEPDDVPM